MTEYQTILSVIVTSPRLGCLQTSKYLWQRFTLNGRDLRSSLDHLLFILQLFETGDYYIWVNHSFLVSKFEANILCILLVTIENIITMISASRLHFYKYVLSVRDTLHNRWRSLVPLLSKGFLTVQMKLQLSCAFCSYYEIVGNIETADTTKIIPLKCSWT